MEFCLDAIVLPNEEQTALVCLLELGHEGPHSNGDDASWVSG